MLLADTKNEEAPLIDPFKTGQFGGTAGMLCGTKNEIADKVTRITSACLPVKGEVGETEFARRTHNFRWTTVENQFSRKKKRLFEDMPRLEPTRADLIPLYSSFNPQGVFSPEKGD